MLSSFWHHKGKILFAAAVMLVVAVFVFWQAMPAQAQNPDGDLRIEPITAYNLIVDSNVLSPSTYAPTSAMLSAKFCNDGDDNLTDVMAYIGDFAAGTPGEYPVRDSGDGSFTTLHPHLVGTGLYYLVHEGGSAGLADASRYIGALAPGECSTQYWLVSYPRKSNGPAPDYIMNAGNTSVTGGSVGPEDDLFLNYDFWAVADDNGTTRTADVSRRVTMRNEISAAANKIWPNTTSHVPDEYLTLIGSTLGWDTLTPGGGGGLPGTVFRTQGFWYDFGNVGAGFDNNGDLVPDRNAWVQPVGDPGAYDTGCFRLYRTYGIVIVKLNDGTDLLIPFEDQLYFENLPDNNTGAVGLVYYEYISLDGVCVGQLTPYQEVASGNDNEKFNGDFGYTTPPATTLDPSDLLPLDKSVNLALTTLPGTLTYRIEITNTATVSVGLPQFGMPLVISDTIPAGTTYVGGSAASGLYNTPPSPNTFNVKYSTNGGVTWTSSEPVPASSVTTLQWWLSGMFEPGTSGFAGYQVTVPNGYPDPLVTNYADTRFGSGKPYARDAAHTLVSGPYQIAGTIFADTGALADYGDGVMDTGETGNASIDKVIVSLYLDLDGDGVLDPEDVFLMSDPNATDDLYGFTFTGLPGSTTGIDYLIVVDTDDPDLAAGWTNTNATTRSVTITNASQSGYNFGFAPALVLDKKHIGGSTVNGLSYITYDIDVSNRMPGDGTADHKCQYTLWAPTGTGAAGWDDTGVAGGNFGADEPDGLLAWAYFAGTGGNSTLTGSGFNLPAPAGSPTIDKIELLARFYVSGPLDDDDVELRVSNSGGTYNLVKSFTQDEINLYHQPNASRMTTLAYNVSTAGWTWASFSNATTGVRVLLAKQASGDPRYIYVDAVGLRVTSSQTCGSSDVDLTDVPLSDTYNADHLEYVSSIPSGVNSVVGSSGTITWDNIGPIYSGGTRTIQVTFLVKNIDLGSDGNPDTHTITNTATITGATFGSGLPANDATDTVSLTANPGGAISGVVWYNGPASPGNGTFDTGEYGIGGVLVRLCSNSNCNGTIYAATQTDSSGYYYFGGLVGGTYYIVVSDGTGTPLANYTANYQDDGSTNNNYDNVTINLTDGISGNNAYVDDRSTPIPLEGRDFGYRTTSHLIFGSVYIDNDGDGTREPGENPVGGVTVRLYTNASCTGTATATTTTRSMPNLPVGYYEFATGLSNNTTYYICVDGTSTPISSYTNSADPDTTLDGITPVTTGATTTAYGSYDFGYRPYGTYTIGNELFFDWDGDGVRDPNDEGIPYVTLNLYEDLNGDGVIDPLYDALIATTETSQSGGYSFTNLPANTTGIANYLVVVDTADPDFPAGAVQTTDFDGVLDGQSSVNTSQANIATGVDFGYTVSGAGSIGDLVWFDRDGDGLPDGGQEVGLAGITVSLQVDFNGDGTYVDLYTTSTDASGAYLFENLPVCATCNYRVVVDTADADLPLDGFGSTYVPTTATSVNMTLTAALISAGDHLEADFGFTALGVVGDTVYWDANGNGTQDSGEAGISGITVSLYNSGTGPVIINGVSCAVNALCATVDTDADGKYLFSGLPVGSYSITVGSITGDPLQTADPDSDGTTCLVANSDPDLANCDDSVTVSVVASQTFMGADFGYQPTGVIGDRVWVNNLLVGGVPNSLSDAGEAGIPGVTVRLYIDGDNNGTITGGEIVYSTATTDAEGYYFFQGVPDGNYVVGVTAPSGFVQNYDPDPVTNGETRVIVSGGAVTQVGNCTTSPNGCDGEGDTLNLDADFGYAYGGTNTLSGGVCVDGGGDPNGWCGNGGINTTDPAGTGETAAGGQTVYLYRFDNDLGAYGIYEPELGDRVTLLSSTVTAADGTYSFSSVPSARVLISVGAPIDYARLTTVDGDRAGANVTEITTATSFGAAATGAYQVYDLSGTSNTVLPGFDFEFRSTLQYDFGDLPYSGSWSYGTSLANNGPSHILPQVVGIYLGTTPPDAEANSLGDLSAASDDNNGDDEDGITLLGSAWYNGPWDGSYTSGGQIEAVVDGTLANGWLVGWIDWNTDGDFNDEGEMVVSRSVSPGTLTLDIDIPDCVFLQSGCTATLGDPRQLYARFRIFTSSPILAGLAYSGAAVNGEVEDYLFSFEPTAITLVRLDGSPAQAWPAWVPYLLLVGVFILIGLGLFTRRRKIA